MQDLESLPTFWPSGQTQTPPSREDLHWWAQPREAHWALAGIENNLVSRELQEVGHFLTTVIKDPPNLPLKWKSFFLLTKGKVFKQNF